MGLIVQKFGGTSVADSDRIRNVARIITETYRRGHNVVVVLSAQGDTTDDLIAKAAEINPRASQREMDMLLSTGEQISCSLCAMAIEAMGYPVVSLTGWQAGFRTNSSYSNARIKTLRTERVLAELEEFCRQQSGWKIADDNREGLRVSVDGGEGWFLLRMSVHDPILPMNLESNLPGGVRKTAAALVEFFSRFDRLDITPLHTFLNEKGGAAL